MRKISLLKGKDFPLIAVGLPSKVRIKGISANKHWLGNCADLYFLHALYMGTEVIQCYRNEKKECTFLAKRMNIGVTFFQHETLQITLPSELNVHQSRDLSQIWWVKKRLVTEHSLHATTQHF